ncbi:MAG: hypothetical protein LBD95_00390 [Clostridiales Family XIII bacterium]|jgi:hypothetical protein|nr:hypothetical protein [Clostridiales Family XIII bacterium]
MNKLGRPLCMIVPAAALFLLLFFAVCPQAVSAASPPEIKYSPLYEAGELASGTFQPFAPGCNHKMSRGARASKKRLRTNAKCHIIKKTF